ncbi:MAG: PEP-CTERM sorting domain-containing protein [Kiritimatiellae bacterium]|jgi:hypothetical protein|nr:PEP-CTERM sorting domain-containing protein [Kiritimatiellia bacterium]
MKIKRYVSFLSGMIISMSSYAAPEITTTWDGEAGLASSDYSWTTGLNWVGNTAPDNADYGPTVQFTDTYVGNQTPNVDGSRQVQVVKFINSVGWSITGSQLTLREINSSGSGTNTMNNVKTWGGGNNAWTVTTGNTLELNTLYLDNTRRLTLSGGGTLAMNSAIGGWSSDRNIYVNDVTLNVDASYVFSSTSAKVYMNDVTGSIILKNTAAQLTTWIGNGTIVDNTTIGLSAADIGGGYAQVSVIPEPSTGAILILGGLGLFYLLRCRRA